MSEELWICTDPTLPYRAGNHWNWRWIIPGEPLFFQPGPNVRPYSVIAIHPMDDKYPFHRYVGGANRDNIPAGCKEGEKEPPQAVYIWLTYIKGEQMSGHMPFWDSEHPNFSFPENRPDLTKAYCGRCSFCGEVYYSDGIDYACEGCKA